MEAITRKEMFMDAAAKGDVSGLPVPVTREEMYLYIKASGDTTGILEPITRREIFWHAMCIGDATDLPAPVTREELFLLAAATGETEGLPEPITRMEIYLKAIAEAGGGGGGDKPWEEMTWDEVIAATKNGKYKNFEIGAMKELDLGSEGIVHMQIVGIDADELADGSGKAPLTLISKELLETRHNMNSTASTTGGWEASGMRTYLRENVKPLIPTAVASEMKEVTKHSKSINPANANATTTDDIWIPSVREVNGGDGYETSGPVYSGVFIDNNSRQKNTTGESDNRIWWLRSAHNTTFFRRVSTKGVVGNYSADADYSIALGFCL